MAHRNNNLTKSIIEYLIYRKTYPSEKLQNSCIAESVWGALNGLDDDHRSADFLASMKADFEKITLYLQNEHKRLYIEEQQSQGKVCNSPSTPKTYSVEDAARFCSCSEEAIRKAIRTERIEASKEGSRYILTESAVASYKRQKRKSA